MILWPPFLLAPRLVFENYASYGGNNKIRCRLVGHGMAQVRKNNVRIE